MDDRLQKKLDAAKRHNDIETARYWKVRLATIEYLGSKCDCGESDISKLEIHHVVPTLMGGYKGVNGNVKLKEWRAILDGKVKAKLYCHDCHINKGHNGNTNALKVK